jgi:predicted nucleic acid-binding protein
MSYLVDTNVLSELLRKAPNLGVETWAGQVGRIYLSIVTLEEICFGLGWKPNPRVLARFEKIIEEHCDVLPATEAIARRSGALRGQLQALGKHRSQADMLIAATAAIHGLTLVTRNLGDFEGCGISVLNPFSS